MNKEELANTLRQIVEDERRSAMSKEVRELIQRAEDSELHVPCDIFHIATLLAMDAEPVKINEKTSDGKYKHIVIFDGKVYSARTKGNHEGLDCYKRSQ